jgi:DNA polymerase III, delta subunit
MTPEQVRVQLAGSLPPALLVLGPQAWALASEAAGPGWDVRETLDAQVARQVRADAWMSPAEGGRVFLLRLDGVTEQVQHMLLKVLEEPPPGIRFVLAASRRPLKTVASRCLVLTLGSTGDVGDVPEVRDVAAVGAAIKAARAGQVHELSEAVRGWAPAHAGLLSMWAGEAASGRWRVFGPGLAPGVSQVQALRLAAELGRWRGSRLGPAVALEQVFSRR